MSRSHGATDLSETLGRQERIDRILDHWEHPRNYGPLPDASAVGEAHNPQCGDVLTMRLLFDSGGRVKRAKFAGKGCTISIAAASMATELLVGKSASEVAALTSDVVLDLIGRDIASTRLVCAGLGLESAQRAAKEYGRRVVSSPGRNR